MTDGSAILAIDIGNSRVKLGRFDLTEAGELQTGATGLPEPGETFAFAPVGEQQELAPLADWLEAQVPAGARVVIGSVNRQVCESLVSHLQRTARSAINQLAAATMPIENLTAEPDRVGVDRLAAAVAVNGLRRAGSPAIAIDFGTAITVDLVDAEGAFRGGAILPGVTMAADALHRGTDALPSISPKLEGKSPEAVGRDTQTAIEAGLYWGTVGAIRELIARQRDTLTKPPQVYVTGSASPELAKLLATPEYTVRYLPHLVLAGLAMATMRG